MFGVPDTLSPSILCNPSSQSLVANGSLTCSRLLPSVRAVAAAAAGIDGRAGRPPPAPSYLPMVPGNINRHLKWQTKHAAAQVFMIHTNCNLLWRSGIWLPIYRFNRN